jgi:membrane associated rhomboid family serine protease
MFFVLPTQSATHVRRWPLCTIVIIALNALVWAATLVREHAIDQAEVALAERAADVLTHHRGIEPSENLAFLLVQHPRALWRVDHPSGTGDGLSDTLAREHVKQIEDETDALWETDLRRQLAFGPRHADVFHAASAAFTHSSWEHFGFNMWFLWLLGIALEDRLGRWFYSLFYLLGGVASAVVQSLAVSGGIIGASGAIAAVMGALAVLLPLSFIQLRVLALVPIPINISGRFGTIHRLIPPFSIAWLKLPLRAWFVLFLWGGLELYFGATDHQSHVGHWAHAGGFAFGVIIAVLLRLTGFDERLDRAVEEHGAQRQDARLLAASALIDEGKPGVAIMRLRQLLGDPKLSPIDVQLEMLRAAEKARSKQDELSARRALLELYLRSGGPVRELWAETRARGFEAEIGPELRARLDTARP